MINCRFCGDSDCCRVGSEKELDVCSCYCPVSNAERWFRRATDEEIANLIYGVCMNDSVDNEEVEKKVINDILRWLKKKAVE